MEPLDPAKHEGRGFSKRRLSSILKAPRRSVRVPEPQQQENVVECAKPVEKRNSRRVSFAPANDVLLFSKEAKTASPTRSPLQEIIPAAPQNRVQVEVTEDGIQQIMGMETLLNAPLHAAQQREAVTFDPRQDFGERTVMFSDDAFMDMTQSQTINIASDAELFGDISLHNPDTVKAGSSVSLPGSRNVDFSAEKLNISSSVAALDAGFQNFLESLSKPGVPSVGPPSGETRSSLSRGAAQTADPDKENQAPPSVFALLEKSLTTSSRTGDQCFGSSLWPEDDVSLDVTEAQTGCVQGLADDDDDPFQFLFPSQEMYKTKPQQISRTPTASNPKAGLEASFRPTLQTETQRNLVRFDAEDDDREKTVRFSADDACMDVTRSHTVNISTDLQLQPQSLGFSPVCGEKTVRFSANDAAMDMTQCLTVNIDSNLVSDSVFPGKKQEGLDVITEMMPAAAQFSQNEDSLNGETLCPGDDVSMDVTEAQTGRILGITDDPEDPLQCLLPTQDKLPQSGLKRAAMTSQQQDEALRSSNHKGVRTSLTAPLKTKMHQVNFDPEDDDGEKTVRFSADDAKSLSVNISTDSQLQLHRDVNFLPSGGEKTLRFTADDAAMDVTQCLTVNIATDVQMQLPQNVNFLSSGGEKTLRFTADDACMDVTRSHTVNIAADFHKVDVLPAGGEKTLRFTATDAAMDVTRSHTVNIATDLEPRFHHNVGFIPACGEKTLRFTADDAAMDVTRSHTVNIAADSQLQSQQNVDVLPVCGEKTLRFTADDAAVDVTQCLTVNIGSNSLLPHTDSNILSTHESVDFPFSATKTRRPQRNPSSSAPALDPGLKTSVYRSGPWAGHGAHGAAAAAAPSSQQSEDTSGFLHQPETQTAENEAPASVKASMEKPGHRALPVGPEDDVNNDVSGTGLLLGRTSTDEPPQFPSSSLDLDPNPEHVKTTEVTSQQSSEAQGPSTADEVGITNLPDSLDSNEADTRKDQTGSLPQQVEGFSSDADHDVDAAPSRKSRRMSLADLQTKLKRLSHVINSAPDINAMESCAASLPQLQQDVDSDNKTRSRPLSEPEPEAGLVNTQQNTQAGCEVEEEQASATATPFRLKTQQLMSRLSMGSFKAKLPQRSKAEDPQKLSSAGEPTRTVSATSRLSSFEDDGSNIYDEELGSCEDVSETLDRAASLEFDLEEELLADDVFEQDVVSSGRKRRLLEDAEDTEEDKKMKTSSDAELGLQPHFVECDDVSAAAAVTTTDAGGRSEATFESTFKQSLFESQLEDFASDVQRKLDDGSVTVLEFFKLFNIDFVIHNPRHSVLPGRLLADEDRTALDVLRDRHIHRPKQLLYQAQVLGLTEQVEGLKQRMWDLDRPLQTVNRALWEDVRSCSEDELKCFGAKLKERNNLFRKMSKVRSHEAKEELYSSLLQAQLEEQQKLRRAIQEADGTLGSLDDCICQLETEITEVQEKGFEDEPSVRSLQEEMQRVTEALAAEERQTSELETQKKQNSDKLQRLKVETRNLQSQQVALHLVNEWTLGQTGDDCSVFCFLHQTLLLQLLYEKPPGNEADNQPERKISNISFKLQLDAAASQDHARLVHQLLLQHVQEETGWVEKYPTSRHVPKLLHDVGLVVSRCRLLGDELRLLKLWGRLRLHVLHISCVDTRVKIIFSSLPAASRFEVIFSVSLIDHIYSLQVQRFNNMIGNTTIQQIEEIVASFSPAKNLLTKIVKKIHENLLC